jgi:hypothetical protein
MSISIEWEVSGRDGLGNSVINWSNIKLKFTSGIGCLGMAGLWSEVYGKHLPFWVVMLVTMPPLVIFLFLKPDELRPSLVRPLHCIAAIWYFTLAIGLTILFFNNGKKTAGWPIAFVCLAIGSIPCGVVLWRTLESSFRIPPKPDLSKVHEAFSLIGLRVILILEDDQDRIDRFTAALQTIDPISQIMVWRSAKKMIQEMDAYLPYARLISLDHDLYPMAGDTEDPGDGLEIAKHLALKKPQCPIIIHSSNGDRATMMAGEFELAGVPAKVIAPLGADWIEAYWAQVVVELLKVESNGRT